MFGTGGDEITEAFRTLVNGGEEKEAGGPAPPPVDPVDVPMATKRLLELLETGGERIAPQELQSCLKALMGPAASKDLPSSMDPKWFADNILGFEDEDDDEGGEA